VCFNRFVMVVPSLATILALGLQPILSKCIYLSWLHAFR